MADDVRYDGHRGRLLERFEHAGLSSLHDHEAVELLLTYAIHRRDVKPLAKELLARFGSLSGLLHAGPERLMEAPGVGRRAALLVALLEQFLTRCLKERFERLPLAAHRSDVEQYLRFHFGHLQSEYVAVLFLDNGNRITAAEIIAEGTVNQCALYPRTVIERAIRRKAASVVLAHNHPGGSLKPSEADWQVTVRLVQAGKLLDIQVLDHIVISKDGVASLRENARWPG